MAAIAVVTNVGRGPNNGTFDYFVIVGIDIRMALSVLVILDHLPFESRGDLRLSICEPFGQRKFNV